jgi:cytochrome d ubiquinol oxidase subunit I
MTTQKDDRRHGIRNPSSFSYSICSEHFVPHLVPHNHDRPWLGAAVALGWALLFFKLRYNRTGEERWMEAYRFWVKIFAPLFAMGVVSGITMSFQFGTNWPGFMEKVGNIAGPLLAYEILTAFFLEAVFLGIMLFGFSRVPNWMHTLATFLLAFGTLMSAF